MLPQWMTGMYAPPRRREPDRCSCAQVEEVGRQVYAVLRQEVHGSRVNKAGPGTVLPKAQQATQASPTRRRLTRPRLCARPPKLPPPSLAAPPGEVPRAPREEEEGRRSGPSSGSGWSASPSGGYRPAGKRWGRGCCEDLLDPVGKNQQQQAWRSSSKACAGHPKTPCLQISLPHAAPHLTRGPEQANGLPTAPAPPQTGRRPGGATTATAAQRPAEGGERRGR